jgi:hypothetical protein
MTQYSGSFSGQIKVLTIMSLSDVQNHELQIAQVTGLQTSTDANWNAARVTYWGTSDMIAGNGMQQGYYVNDRADGERDWETFN